MMIAVVLCPGASLAQAATDFRKVPPTQFCILKKSNTRMNQEGHLLQEGDAQQTTRFFPIHKFDTKHMTFC